MGDPLVSEAMLSLANAEGIASLVVAARLPEILADQQQCRQRLIDLARHLKADRGFRSVTAGFERLGIAESDKELTRQPKHSFIWSVARWYGQDPELRKEITGALSRLPATLRRALAERLALVAQDDDFAQSVMSEYDQDCDAATSTAAAIGYYESTVQRRQVNENDLDRLRQSLVAVGMAQESEPQAAFASLLTLDRLDTFLSLKRTRDDAPVKIRLYEQLQGNPVLFRHIARHWERLKRSVSGAQWSRLEDLRAWCSDELGRQLAKEGIPEHGLNLAEGNIRPVAHVLLELLEKIRE